jgi:hypothetical protein
MRKFLVNQLSAQLVLLIAIYFLYPQLSWSEEFEEIISKDKFVTIDCQYKPIHEVLIDISKQSGLRITYDQKLENESILASIAFNDRIRAIDAVIRLLRGKDTVIEFSNDAQNLNIRMFYNIN